MPVIRLRIVVSPVEVNTQSIDVRHNTNIATIVSKRDTISDNVPRRNSQEKVLQVADTETDPEVMVVAAGDIVLVREGSRIKMSNECNKETKSMIWCTHSKIAVMKMFHRRVNISIAMI
jgi:hypothetical protein